jgi:hypothetical protein
MDTDTLDDATRIALCDSAGQAWRQWSWSAMLTAVQQRVYDAVQPAPNPKARDTEWMSERAARSPQLPANEVFRTSFNRLRKQGS